MSRTFRRKGYELTLNNSWARSYIRVLGPNIIWDPQVKDNGCHGYRPMNKAELWHRTRANHGESRHNLERSPNKSFRSEFESALRARNRHQLHLFLKVPDYEPMVEDSPENYWWYWS